MLAISKFAQTVMAEWLNVSRPFSSTAVGQKSSRCDRMKVTVFGASGNLGPPLALLLHQSAQLDELALVDASPGCGDLAHELNGLDNRATVVHHPPDQADAALRDANIVMLANSALRVTGEVRRARISEHAQQAARVVSLIGQHCPQAMVLVLSAPISGVVPVVVEAARRAGVLRPESRVLGVPAVAKARAAAVVGALVDEDPFHMDVPITGGTSSSACVPLVSQLRARNALTKLEAGAVVSAVQSAGGRLARLRTENSLPAMGVAFAAARFTDNVINALLGEGGVRDHAFVACDLVPGVPYLTAPVELHSGGARVQPLGPMTGTECALLRAACRLVQRDLDVAEHVIDSLFGPLDPPTPNSPVPPPGSSPQLPKEIPVNRCPTWLPKEGCI